LNTQISQRPAATKSRAKYQAPWLRSARWDTGFIIAPALVSSLLVLIFRNEMEASRSIPLWVWISFVLLIDVAHVYATLFRTYLDPKAFQKHSTLLFAAPLLCWMIGSLLYSIKALWFWRALAYLAVFHFIRQQFGFLKLYSREDPPAFTNFKWLDTGVIYLATLYPLLFWHTNLPRNFSWFVEGDFLESVPQLFAQVAVCAYGLIGVLYIVKESILCFKTLYFNVPRNLLLVATAISWWVGIIAVNSDMAFTITNVVSHGIPYMALIWLYQHRQATGQSSALNQNVPKISRLTALLLANGFIFFLSLALMAYVEEGFWDGLIWRDHLGLFFPFARLPVITDSVFLALLVPFLALPQSTHYVLDGFIWRIKDGKSLWSTERSAAAGSNS
jgi:hypothetical protein